VGSHLSATLSLRWARSLVHCLHLAPHAAPGRHCRARAKRHRLTAPLSEAASSRQLVRSRTPLPTARVSARHTAVAARSRSASTGKILGCPPPSASKVAAPTSRLSPHLTPFCCRVLLLPATSPSSVFYADLHRAGHRAVALPPAELRAVVLSPLSLTGKALNHRHLKRGSPSRPLPHHALRVAPRRCPTVLRPSAR
jgi:hypothetical protein